MKSIHYISISFIFSLLMLSSCLGGNDSSTDYSEWRNLNTTFIENAEKEMENGMLKYQKIVPPWDNTVFTLVCWHNDRSETLNKLTPLSNSTVDVKYTLTTIEGDTLDSSASFRCVPNTLVTGFWTAVTNMNEGDTITAIMPYNAGYGTTGSGSVKPYSTLIFGIRLDSIVAFEKPSHR